MKKILLLISLCALVVSIAGCKTSVRDNVPATQISGFIGDKPFNFTGPKDLEFTKLKVSAETNGSVTLEVTDLKAKTNPDVITMTGAAYEKMRNADAAHDSAVIKSTTEGAGGLAGEFANKAK